MENRRRDYLITFTILGLALCAYQGLQYVGAYAYSLAVEWLTNQEAGGLRWLSGLFYSDWTGVLVQYGFVLGVPFLIAWLILGWLPKDKRPFRTLPGEDFMVCLVISMGAGYVFNFIGSAVNMAFSLFNNKDFLEMNPVVDMMSELTPGLVFYTCFLGPFMEELMFRGILLKRARRFGDRTAVVFCAVAFGLMHGNLSQFLYATAIGLACGFLAVKSNGIRYNVLLHIFINSYSVVMIAGESLLLQAGLELGLALYSLAMLAAIGFLIVGGALFFIEYGPRMYRQITLANGPRCSYRKYIYWNPGFLLYAMLCVLEMVSYLF